MWTRKIHKVHNKTAVNPFVLRFGLPGQGLWTMPRLYCAAQAVRTEDKWIAFWATNRPRSAGATAGWGLGLEIWWTKKINPLSEHSRSTRCMSLTLRYRKPSYILIDLFQTLLLIIHLYSHYSSYNTTRREGISVQLGNANYRIVASDGSRGCLNFAQNRATEGGNFRRL